MGSLPLALPPIPLIRFAASPSPVSGAERDAGTRPCHSPRQFATAKPTACTPMNPNEKRPPLGNTFQIFHDPSKKSGYRFRSRGRSFQWPMAPLGDPVGRERCSAEGLGNDYPVHAGAEGERIDGQFWGGIHLRERGRDRGTREEERGTFALGESTECPLEGGIHT